MQFFISVQDINHHLLLTLSSASCYPSPLILLINDSRNVFCNDFFTVGHSKKRTGVFILRNSGDQYETYSATLDTRSIGCLHSSATFSRQFSASRKRRIHSRAWDWNQWRSWLVMRNDHWPSRRKAIHKLLTHGWMLAPSQFHGHSPVIK